MQNPKGMLRVILLKAAGFLAGLLVESRIERARAQARPDSTFPAVPGQKGGEDITGRAQKFRPRPGANSALLVGEPVYAAWK